MDAHFDPLAELTDLEAADSFVPRHVAPSQDDVTAMLSIVGAANPTTSWPAPFPPGSGEATLDALPPAIDEAAVIAELRDLALQNGTQTSLIGRAITAPIFLR